MKLDRIHKTIVFFILFLIPVCIYAQTAGDYRTNTTGAWNWTTVANWQKYVAGAWVAATDYPGQNAGAGTINILNNTNVTLNVTPANNIGALTFANGTTSGTGLTITGFVLNVTGAVTFGDPGGNNGDQTLTIGTGTLNCSSMIMPETGVNQEVLTISLSTGTINCTGDISMLTGTAARNVITVTGAATINVGGSFSGGGTFTAGTGTVNYNGTVAQNVGAFTYFNLSFTNTGTKTLLASASSGGNLLIDLDAVFSLGTTAATFSVTGTSTINGTFDYNSTTTKTVTLTGALSGSGTIDMSGGSLLHILNLRGATNTIGTLTTAAVASTINYNVNGVQTVFASPNYRNLTISGGNTKTLSGNITVNNDLAVTAGTFDLGATASVISISGSAAIAGTLTFGTSAKTVNLSGNLSGAGTINMNGAGLAHILNLGGANNAITTFNTTALSGSIVNYNRIGDQQVFTTANYRNLTISGSGIKTFQGATTINNDLLVSGGTLNLGTGAWTHTISGDSQVDGTVSFGLTNAKTLTISGNLNGSGVIDMSNGSLNHIMNLGGSTNTIGTLSTAAAGSTINYNRAGDQTVFANAGYRNITISGSGIKTLQGDATIGANLNITSGTFNLGTVASAVTVSGSTTISGGLNFGTGTDKNVTLNNNLTLNATGSIDMSGSDANRLYLRGTTNTYTAGGVFTSGAGSQTVYYDADANQTIMQVTYNNLVIGNFNSASIIPRTKTQSGATIVNGNLNINGYTSSVTTLQLGNFNFTVSGVTNVNGYGNISDSGASTNIFNGLVTIGVNGIWNVPQPSTFRNGLLVNSSSFTSGSTYTFDTNNQIIDGTVAFTLPAISLGTAGRTLTNANTNGITVTGQITGTGNLTNGTAANNAVINLSVGGATPDPLALTGTADFTSFPNTVNFNSVSNQTISARNFYNLTISGARTNNSVTLGPGIIRISAVFSPAATFSTGNYVASGTIEFNSTSPQNIPSLGTASYNSITVSGGSTKTLTGNVTLGAAGILNLNNSIIELAGNNLVVSNNAAGAITPGMPFSSGNMVSTGGAGYLQKNGTVAAGFQIIYPVGSGGYYTPMTITSIGSIIPTYIRVRAVPSAINPSYILKYWSVTASGALNNVTATFQYDPAEANGASQNISYSPDAGTTWQTPPASGASSFGTNSFTITGNNPFNGWWTMGLRTYYSYQSGSWNDFSTWTSDPSGTLQIGSSIPDANDIVVILSGRTVSLESNIGISTLDITINEGGFLNMGSYSFTSGIKAFRGQGTIQLASPGFPVAVTNTFVNAGGGTTEYMANINLPVAQTIYNNLKINTSGIVTQLNNLTLNGNLNVTQGTFRVNDNTSARRQLTVNGNVTVANGASITVGTGVTNTTTNPTGIATTLGAPFINYYDSHSHRIVILGDFTNNGSVRFTNLTFPVYDQFPPTVAGATTGFATVYFRGNASNTLTCNGPTDFYNLVVDKGTDQSYSLTINSSGYANFRLFGANIAGGDVTAPATTSNPNLKKALWIRTGTLILEGSLVIPSLSEGNDATAAALQYIIPANGALKVNGVDVVVQSTSDLYEEVNAAYGVSGGTGIVNGVITGPNESGLLVLGKLEINDGFLTTKESRGLLYNSAIAGQIFINGGKVDIKQFRSLTPGTGLTAYTQTGGVVEIRGRFQRIPSAYAAATDLSAAPINTVRLNDAALLSTAGSFSIENASDIFNISGGTINIYDVPAPGPASRAYDIFASSSNYSVSGGTVTMIPTLGTGGTADATPWLISSAAPVNNMVINRVSGATAIQLNTGYPLDVINNLTIQSGEFTANGLNVSIGGNFTVSAGTSYSSGANFTIFDGSGPQSFVIDLAGALTINNLTIDKPAGTLLTLSGSQAVLNVAGAFSLSTGNFNDNGKTVNISGNLYNSGIHSGTGKIVLNGTGLQTIDGSGTGEFQNMELNNTNAATAPVSLVKNTVINGQLTFSQNKLFNIGTYNLKLNESATISGAGSSRYIQTSGTAGDGGLTKVFSAASSSFTFPTGVINYTPGSLTINGTATAFGSITVVPVNYAHPNVTSAGRSLTYFWKVRSSGFTLGPATVTHGYSYNDANVVTGAGVSENEYVAARYNSTALSWSRGVAGDVDETNNIIGEPGSGSFLENTSFIDGDYTAGDDNAVNPFGTPAIFYSRQNGNWGSTSTWSLTGHTVTNPPAVPPGAGDIVIIGNGHTVTFATPAGYLTNPNTDPRSCASLQVSAGSTLDMRFNPASVFSMVQSHPSGNGTIRIAADYDDGSTFAFPGGDFSDFNQNLGTTELYSTNPNSGTTYWLPNGITSYGNLILSPLGGSNIIFPNNDLTIFGNLITKGQNVDSWFCPTWSGNYPTAPAARIPKTITIRGNLDIQGGALIWYGNAAITQNVVVYGNVTVGANSSIDVWSGATSQSLSIGGNLINNTTGAGNERCDFTLLPVTFFGNTSSSISNTINNPVTIFDRVTVNKGNSQATTLTIDIGGTLTLVNTDNWLTLQNGTLRYMRTNPPAGANFTISTVTPFTIPATAGLYIDYANANNINILIGNSNNNNGDLILGGILTIIRGNVLIGSSANDNHNDIEYTGGGSSEIDIQGGTLVVNGNIRRPGTSGGILKYSQSGNSSVTINGRGTLTTNAKLEILNPGSQFNMSGTSTLTILRGGGSGIFGDLYLRPENSDVTGGTIILQPVNAITAAEENFKIDANVALNNLTITGFAAADAARMSLSVNPLILKGNLNISNASSFLTTNNLNVTIAGNFTNSGTYTFGTNTTSFNGNSQSILGSTVTNFFNLDASPLTSLSVNNNFTVNGNLTIGSGTLLLSNRRLTLAGNITNNGTYTDDNLTGGIYLAGSVLQQISGTGSFGRLELNNNSGARLNNDVTVQNNLVLTLGKLDINSNQLSLGTNSSIGGSPFTTNNMIVSDGVISSKGVRKFFNVTAVPSNFVFPTGVSGKYTPATLNINANGSVGYINIKPINNNHPGVLDPNNVLDFYWEVESSGISGFDGSLLFKYIPGDIKGIESDYVAARLLVPGTSWSKSTPGPLTDNVDETNHIITFNLPAGTNNLNGEYTAGSDPAIPNDVPQYITISNGAWSDESIWAPVGIAPPCPVGGPNGFIVIINHEVITDINYCFSYKTTINNKLTILSGTFGHNLGQVDGGGTLVLQGGNLPAGNFNSFLSCSTGGLLEYSGTGDYTIIATQFNSVPRLFFTGSGRRILPNKDLTVCSRLVIDGPTLDNTVNNRGLIIGGTLERYNSGAFLAGDGANATVSFQGTSQQNLGGITGTFSGADRFNNLEINNAAGLIIGNGDIEVVGNLLLSDGIISTTTSNRLIISNTLAACVIPTGGTSSSFVSGPLTKNIPGGGSFVFPIGTGSAFGHTFTVTTSGGSPAEWTATYNSPNSTSSSFTAPLQEVNYNEYWSLSADASKSTIVKMAWDANSVLTPLMTQNGISDMRVADFNSGSWQEQPSVTSGNSTVGDVATSSAVSINTTDRNFTIASVSPTRPRASLTPTGPVCGSVGIPVTFSSSQAIPLNYTLTYTINGVVQPVVNITSLPYILPTPVAGAYRLIGFTYNNGLNNGVVDPRVVNVFDNPIASVAGPDQSLCGVSGATLAGNNPAPYSGLWTIISGTGGTLINASQYNTSFTGILGQTYTLRWTISNGLCTTTDDVIISFPVAALKPDNFTSATSPVCQGLSGILYSVPNVPGQTYNWSYSGTGHTINGSGNSVTIDFSLTATSGTLSVTATNSCGTSPARTFDITVTPLPVATFSYAGTPYCPTDPNALPSFSGGGTAGTFSSTAGLVFANTSTGELNISASTPGSYIVTNTIPAASGCGIVIATSPVTISNSQSWTGAISTDWNTAGNWSCGYIPVSTTNVTIPDIANKPVISVGAPGYVNNLTIDINSSLTISGNSIQISGILSSNGTIDAQDGIIVMNGSINQNIAAAVFTGNTIKGLVVNNPAGVTLLGQLNISGSILLTAGNLVSNGNLTLLSTAAQTALIDGNGTGTVTGNMTMQRYLASKFGYKYFSSPFQAATVAEFGDDMDLAASFPSFYRYDEDRVSSGWVNYTTGTNTIDPLTGYAVNFYSSPVVPATVDVTGVVNNGPLSIVLRNNNRPYTSGFNLVGNPYPSPINWDAAAGWTKTNIDNAVYYFKASTTDQFGGTYSSYVNGVSSDGEATAIIPSMQGFFVHVSNGAFPVSGTLSVDNNARVTDLTHPFLKSGSMQNSVKPQTKSLIRLSATYTDNNTASDHTVIYFDEKASLEFNGELDAFKLMNTDLGIPNIYSVMPDGSRLSINALPSEAASSCRIPLGIKTERSGIIKFKVDNFDESVASSGVYLYDSQAGVTRNLINGSDYAVTLSKSEYLNRFYLIIGSGKSELPREDENGIIFSIYSSKGILKVEIDKIPGDYCSFILYNIIGETLFRDRLNGPGTYEFNPDVKDGVYFATIVSGNKMSTKKIFIKGR